LDRKTLKPVLVIWRDAESRDEWADYTEVLEDTKIPDILTLGFLLYSNNELICVTKSIDIYNERVSQTLKIPKGMIIEIKQIKLEY